MPCLPLPPLPLAFPRYPTATLLPDGRVLIMGGTVGVGAGTPGNKDWELLDPNTFTTTVYPLLDTYLQQTKRVRGARGLVSAGTW